MSTEALHGATHVISYFPPYLLGRKSRRSFPDGMWDLQALASYEAGEPVTENDSSMCGPRDTAPAHLAAWAAVVLGSSVTLTPETVEVRPGRVPFLRPWRTELLYYVTPAGDRGAEAAVAVPLPVMTDAEFNAFCAQVDAEAEEARRGGFVSGDALRKGEAAVAEAAPKGEVMTVVSAPPREAPFHPGDFRRLWSLARSWGATYRYRPAAAELAEALRQIDDARRDGPDFLDAFVYGNSIPELRSAALAKAEALWGEKADAAVESVGTICTSSGTSSGTRGSFNATVTVRCLNYAEISS